MTTATASAIRYADEFKSSPRYKAILALFAAVDALEEDAPLNELSALMTRTTQSCSGVERDRIPDLVRKGSEESGHTRRL